MQQTKLITALRTAAKALEDDTFDYDWNKLQACNCGVLVASVMKCSRSEVRGKIGAENIPLQATWRTLVGRLCPVTGTPMNQVFKSLFEIGLTAKDIVELETLSNKEVLAAMPKFIETFTVEPTFFRRLCGDKPTTETVEVVRYNNPSQAAAYMRTWADLLQKRGADDMPEQRVTAQPAAEAVD